MLQKEDPLIATENIQRLALIAFCTDTPGHQRTLSSLHNALSFKQMLLENFQFREDEVILEEHMMMSKNRQTKEYTKGVTTAEQIDLQLMSKDHFFAKNPSLYDRALSFRNTPEKRLVLFIYWDGPGVQAADSHEVCGIDHKGKLIPWERWGRRFAQCKNVFTFMFLNCCRVPSTQCQFEGVEKRWGIAEPLHIKDLKECGTAVIAYTCPPGQTSMEIYSDHLPYSPALQFLSLLKLPPQERPIKDILANLPFRTIYGSNYFNQSWTNTLFAPPPIAKQNTFHSLHRVASQSSLHAQASFQQLQPIADIGAIEISDESEEEEKKSSTEATAASTDQEEENYLRKLHNIEFNKAIRRFDINIELAKSQNNVQRNQIRQANDSVQTQIPTEEEIFQAMRQFIKEIRIHRILEERCMIKSQEDQQRSVQDILELHRQKTFMQRSNMMGIRKGEGTENRGVFMGQKVIQKQFKYSQKGENLMFLCQRKRDKCLFAGFKNRVCIMTCKEKQNKFEQVEVSNSLNKTPCIGVLSEDENELFVGFTNGELAIYDVREGLKLNESRKIDFKKSHYKSIFFSDFSVIKQMGTDFLICIRISSTNRSIISLVNIKTLEISLDVEMIPVVNDACLLTQDLHPFMYLLATTRGLILIKFTASTQMPYVMTMVKTFNSTQIYNCVRELSPGNILTGLANGARIILYNMTNSFHLSQKTAIPLLPVREEDQLFVNFPLAISQPFKYSEDEQAVFLLDIDRLSLLKINEAQELEMLSVLNERVMRYHTFRSNLCVDGNLVVTSFSMKSFEDSCLIELQIDL